MSELEATLQFIPQTPLSSGREFVVVDGYTVDKAYVATTRLNWEIISRYYDTSGLEALSQLAEKLGISREGQFVNPHPANFGVGKLMSPNRLPKVFQCAAYWNGVEIRETFEWVGKKEMKVLIHRYTHELANDWDKLTVVKRRMLLSCVWHGLRRVVKHYVRNNAQQIIDGVAKVERKVAGVRDRYLNHSEMPDPTEYWRRNRTALAGLNRIHRSAIGQCYQTLNKNLYAQLMTALAKLPTLSIPEFDLHDPDNTGCSLELV